MAEAYGKDLCRIDLLLMQSHRDDHIRNRIFAQRRNFDSSIIPRRLASYLGRDIGEIDPLTSKDEENAFRDALRKRQGT